MPTHSMICAHPCPPMLFELRPCIKNLCNVYYPPTSSLGWIGQIKSRSLSLTSTRRASWLAYSLHPRSLTPIWSWIQGCAKPMPTHAHPWTIHTQNIWVWVGMGMGMGTQCRALVSGPEMKTFSSTPSPPRILEMRLVRMRWLANWNQSWSQVFFLKHFGTYMNISFIIKLNITSLSNVHLFMWGPRL
jgi:hypothetical protein